MKFIEFKQAVINYQEKNLKLKLRHFDSEILLEVKYSTPSNQNDSSYIDYLYIDKVKKRIFYVGKSEELRNGWFFKKSPMKINAIKFFKKMTTTSKYDNYDVYFAWNYDLKDQTLFDYIPLSDDIDSEISSDELLSKIIFNAEKGKSFKIKVKNLHENLLKI